ncbi:redox-sensitive transcriptional activator SoxR [Undibacterium crateris]|uniref:redox-sensitive transcriptional activator SoxR n=1 Tax=Undibacterium crateris TaxID=2528175 RepID=UPI00138A5B32|nr:redox-sensitive transcriptional activator SoxR [Undibacterium crateris]NDI85637.1 redox-sensitive transcriptional activator SoxR [Undibacterium crateris]
MKTLTIGEFASRAGIASSAIRFYEEKGLIFSQRNAGGQRRFQADQLRRVAFIKAAQTAGISLEEIRDALNTLPAQRTPNKADWEKISAGWCDQLNQRIANLTALRDRLSSCIGCGCLSLSACALYNPEDKIRHFGSGARYLSGNHPDDLQGLLAQDKVSS